MEEVFIRKYWEDEKILFYIYFRNGQAIKQIEISENGKIFLSADNPQNGESMLYDQSISDLDLDEDDFINDEIFSKAWTDR